jgi:hypothetical protein
MGSHVCRQCLHYVLPDWTVEQVGRCKLSKERFDREVKLPTEHPACKSFEDKLTGKRPGRK